MLDLRNALHAVSAARKLLAARPIPLNKADIRELVDEIVNGTVRALDRRSDQDLPLGDLAPRFHVWTSEFDNPSLRTVMGEVVGPIDVIVTAQASDSASLVLGGGVGRNRSTGKRALVITLNGRYKTSAMSDSLPFQKDDLFALLIHEFTHLRDTPVISTYKTKRGGQLPSLGEDLDEAAYFNDPGEVRAHMQEIVEQVLAMGRNIRRLFSANQTVLVALKNSRTWNDMSPHLTPKNQKLIKKAVYTAMQDAGLLE